MRKPYTFNINWHFQKNLPSYSKIDSQKIYKISRKETMGFGVNGIYLENFIMITFNTGFW